MEKNFRGLIPAKPFGLHRTSVGVREELRKAKALDLLSRIANVGGTRFGPISISGAGGIILDDSTPRPFWTKIIGREKAFEATLLKDVSAEDKEFEVSYDESAGVCPHQLPFYAHLVENEEGDVSGGGGASEGGGGTDGNPNTPGDLQSAPGGADASGVGGNTGVEGGGGVVVKTAGTGGAGGSEVGTGGGGPRPGARETEEPIQDIPGKDNQNLPPGASRKGGPNKDDKKNGKDCGQDGNPKPNAKPKAKKQNKSKFETVLVTKIEDQTGGTGNGSFKWTVKRGQQCTTAIEHKAGDKWEANIPYKWDQVAQLLKKEKPDRGNWDDYVDGRKSVHDGQLKTPAYEVKGIKVPTDGSAKVLMWLGYDHQTYYLFTFFGGCKDDEDGGDTVLPSRKPTYPCSSNRAARVGAAWVVPGKCQLRYYCTDEKGKPKVKTALTSDDKDKPNGVPGLNSAGHARFGTTPRSVLGFLRQFGG